jgi:fumarylpyruvate hydrolase
VVRPCSDIREQIAGRSKFYHLRPGDLILTGTPEGVGPVVAGNRIDDRIADVCEIVLNIGPVQ